ncbi:D-amino-acid transaminase [Larsenimonas rhizosphaerae]|uniref:Aminodeoxychorismate lyase n=1 Tax=Larsenimonas rhizosphaerae TaxID=2944682 RepID=A0AA41ZLR6_9GAMM|nr:D-amino-acid transaminase [Larsenimonas rhizosphaerae]MCX2524471.1 D-amino-acid transaminase [Larsenimonas rhizosphaerae]
MTRTVYVNGEYLAEDQATVSIFDRGFLMGDAVYEVCAVLEGRLVDTPGHFARLRRSMTALSMPETLDNDELLHVHQELVRRNALREGLVYLQLSRGVADRDFAYPGSETPPTLVLFTQAKAVIDSPLAHRGAHVITQPDLRWGRRDIKTVQLLYPSMAKMAARAAGADDAWLVENGLVTEGSSSNAFIVTRDGRLVTRELSSDILHGITRAAVLRLARDVGLVIEERAFTPEEACMAQEAFMTSATSMVTAVVSIDGQALGDGRPGAVAARLRTLYIEESLRQAE